MGVCPLERLRKECELHEAPMDAGEPGHDSRRRSGEEAGDDSGDLRPPGEFAGEARRRGICRGRGSG